VAAGCLVDIFEDDEGILGHLSAGQRAQLVRKVRESEERGKTISVEGIKMNISIAPTEEEELVKKAADKEARKVARDLKKLNRGNSVVRPIIKLFLD
jgi:hypothetical protein